MKKIGLIGGMSFESTITYYEQINRKINERLGGLSSAEILLSSVNFEEIEVCQRENRWEDAGEILARHARILQGGGADFIFICTNTMHRCFDAVQSAVSVPVAHIADATLKALKKRRRRQSRAARHRLYDDAEFLQTSVDRGRRGGAFAKRGGYGGSKSRHL